MSSIDLVILGIVMERPQSAYDIQKDVQYHHFSRWTKVSIPSVYRKVIRLCEQGYLESEIVKGERFVDKALYTITDEGRAYFRQLMHAYADDPVPLLFDFNVVVANLNKLDQESALALIAKLRHSITASAASNREFADQYTDLPLVGRTVFDQQQILYRALLTWLDAFEQQYKNGKSHG